MSSVLLHPELPRTGPCGVLRALPTAPSPHRMLSTWNSFVPVGMLWRVTRLSIPTLAHHWPGTRGEDSEVTADLTQSLPSSSTQEAEAGGLRVCDEDERGLHKTLPQRTRRNSKKFYCFVLCFCSLKSYIAQDSLKLPK